VTCATLADLDPDDRLLIEPLGELGVDAVAAVWDDVAVEWDAFDLAVVRSTWDYPARRTEFVQWARRVPRLVNPADVIEWNTDKRYLADLGAAGVPTVPTTWLAPGDSIALPTSGRYVLKPSVGAGSLDAAAFTLDDPGEATRAREHAERLLGAGTTVMVQPYLAAIDDRGEAALIFVGGKFSHAITKSAMLRGDRATVAGGLFLEESITPRQPSEAEFTVADDALSAVPGGSHRLAYARIDLVPDADGNPILIELELTEPSLYLAYADGAAERFARALAGLADK
jgi:glutathione synthase/RimK-type ligase-like ATP-grasp enzyme